MRLPFSFSFNKKEKIEYFLALLLRHEKAVAVIFEEAAGKVSAIGNHEVYFDTSVEDSPLEEFLDVLDRAITEAESTLPLEIETHKTVFGVKEDWVQDSKIKNDYLVKLKKASEALGLSPIGFLVIHEAITHFLQKEEGAPVSAILAEVDKKNLTISLVRASKIVETRMGKIEGSIAKTADQILQHFTDYEVLPSRIILFDGENHEKLSQQFMKHSWSKSLPFLHVPQIKSLPKAFDAQAVLFGTAVQMGFEIIEDETPAITETHKEPETQKTNLGDSVDDSVSSVSVGEEKKQKKHNEEIEETEEDFGFVIGKDIAKGSLTKTKKTLEEEVPDQEKEEEPIAKEPEIIETQEKVEKSPAIFSALATLQSTIKTTMLQRAPHLPHLPFPTGKKIVFIPPIIIILLILSFVFYVFSVGAEVKLVTSPKVVQQNQDAIFSTTSSTDIGKGIIASETTSVSEVGEVSKVATGKKETGDKAKGNVTLFSKLPESRTFSEGTIITSGNNLEFTLDKAVTVASSSADASAPPSTASVGVTAKEVGKEYNLPSQTKFTIGTLSQSNVVAKNDNAFSGGTKKEVTVVSTEDLENLEKDLQKTLEAKAKINLPKKIPSDKQMIPLITKSIMTKKDFDKDKGAEAKSVKLKATISFETLTYKKGDVQKLLQNSIKNLSTDSLTPSTDPIAYEVTNSKQTEKKDVTATIKLKANLLPTIQNEKLAEEIAGKSFTEAENILTRIPQVTSVDITLIPNISFLPKTLPRNSKNITFSTIRQ